MKVVRRNSRKYQELGVRSTAVDRERCGHFVEQTETRLTVVVVYKNKLQYLLVYLSLLPRVRFNIVSPMRARRRVAEICLTTVVRIIN